MPRTSVFFNFHSQPKKSDEKCWRTGQEEFCFVMVRGKGVFRLIYLINVDRDQ